MIAANLVGIVIGTDGLWCFLDKLLWIWECSCVLHMRCVLLGTTALSTVLSLEGIASQFALSSYINNGYPYAYLLTFR